MSDEPQPCQSCLADVPNVFVSLTEIRGMVWFRRESVLGLRLCRTCLDFAYRTHQRTNLAYGWWSPFAMFLTPIYVFQNWCEHRRARLALAAED
jgi:hypothetical protein